MSGRGLLALDCPRCGTPLPGLDADVAFVCPPCGAAWEVDGATLRPIAYHQIAMGAETDPRVSHSSRVHHSTRINLPAWLFPARIEATPRSRTGPTAIASALAARAAALSFAWVSAATLSRADVFGDWSRDWTRIQPTWKPSADRRPLAGATLASADAHVIAEHILLAEIDRVHDLGDVDVTITLGEPTLLAVPAIVADGRVRPVIGGVDVPLGALDDGVGMVGGGR